MPSSMRWKWIQTWKASSHIHPAITAKHCPTPHRSSNGLVSSSFREAHLRIKQTPLNITVPNWWSVNRPRPVEPRHVRRSVKNETIWSSHLTIIVMSSLVSERKKTESNFSVSLMMQVKERLRSNCSNKFLISMLFSCLSVAAVWSVGLPCMPNASIRRFVYLLVYPKVKCSKNV